MLWNVWAWLTPWVGPQGRGQVSVRSISSALGRPPCACAVLPSETRYATMSTAMNFGSKSFQPRPPDKGSFPLDHFGERWGSRILVPTGPYIRTPGASGGPVGHIHSVLHHSLLSHSVLSHSVLRSLVLYSSGTWSLRAHLVLNHSVLSTWCSVTRHCLIFGPPTGAAAL